MSKSTVALIAFLTGCGAAAIAPLMIPAAHAQTTQRWESFCAAQDAVHPNPAASNFAEIANAAGREGWEPFAITASGSTNRGVICFKRPAP